MLLFAFKSISTDKETEFIERIYTKYMPWIKSRAHRFIEDLNVCEDISQDCIISIIKHSDKLQTFSESQQRAYIKAIVDNTCKNYIKRSKKIITMNKDESSDLHFIPDNTDICYDIEKKSEYNLLKSCITKLNEREKDILIMKFVLELSDQQIADILNIKKDSVRMTVYRIIKKLKEFFKEMELI